MAEISENSERGYYKVDVIANLFGVTVRRVQQLTQEGVINTVPTSSGNRYELAPTIQKYIKYLSDKAYGRSRSEEEAKLKESKLKAEVSLKESQTELHKLRTDIAAGKYISVEAVKMDYGRFFVEFKNFALSLPSKVAGLLSGRIEPVEMRAIENEMRAEVRKRMKNFVLNAILDEDTDGKSKDAKG